MDLTLHAISQSPLADFALATAATTAENTVHGWISVLEQDVGAHPNADDDGMDGDYHRLHPHQSVILELEDFLLSKDCPQGNCFGCRYKVRLLLRHGARDIVKALFRACQYEYNQESNFFETTFHVMYLLFHQDHRLMLNGADLQDTTSVWHPLDAAVAKEMLASGFADCIALYMHCPHCEKSHFACRILLRLIHSIFSACHFGDGGTYRCYLEQSPLATAVPGQSHTAQKSLKEWARVLLPYVFHIMVKYGLDPTTSTIKMQVEASRTFCLGLQNIQVCLALGVVSDGAVAAALGAIQQQDDMLTSLERREDDTDVMFHLHSIPTSKATAFEMLQILLRGIALYVNDLETQEKCAEQLKILVHDEAKCIHLVQLVEARYHVAAWKCSPAA